MSLPKLTSPHQFHVALSYASEDRQYVKEVKTQLESAGLQVYFWERLAPGVPLNRQSEEIFEKQADCCVIFISRHYASKKTTLQELKAAVQRAKAESGHPPYLIPARFDKTPIPDLPEDIIYEEVGPKTAPEELARKVRSIVFQRARLAGSRPTAAPPRPATPFIGRSTELKTILKLLRENTSLILLHGEGGIGKTRLADQVVDELGNHPRSYKISFKGGEDKRFMYTQEQAKSLVFSEISKAVGARETEGVPIQQSLEAYLKEQGRLFLLLDGFEHLREACYAVENLTRQCPGLQVLITSRFLPEKKLTLAYHYELGALQRSDAVQLFKERALAAGAQFEIQGQEKEIEEICELVGNLALAITVVASASYGYSSLQYILADLHQYLKGNASGLRLREEMHASIRWSYDLLPPEEQELFQRLAVFEGGCTPKSAFEIFARHDRKNNTSKESLEALQMRLYSLVDKALLWREDEDGGPRFGMTDTVREFALHCLRQGEGEAALRRRYAEHFTAVAERADRGIKSCERQRYMEELERERDNLKAALEWSRSEGGDYQLGLRLAGALFWFWNLKAEFTEGSSWLNDAVQTCGPAYAKALYCAGGLAFLQGKYDEAKPLLEASVAAWRTVKSGHERELGYTLIVLGMTVLSKDRNSALAYEEEAREIFEKHQNEDRWGFALALNDLGNVRRQRGEISDAQKLYDESLKIWTDMGDTWGLPLTRSNLGFLLMMDKQFGPARKELEKALEIQEKDAKDLWGSAETLKYLGDLALREKKYQEAEKHYLRSLQSNQEIGRVQLMVGCLAGLAASSAGKGKGLAKLAAFLFGVAEPLRQAYGVSDRTFDQEMFQPAWRGFESALRNSAGLQKEHKDGARDEAPSAKLTRAIQRVFQDLLRKRTRTSPIRSKPGLSAPPPPH